MRESTMSSDRMLCFHSLREIAHCLSALVPSPRGIELFNGAFFIALQMVSHENGFSRKSNIRNFSARGPSELAS
jgi:hypothetical protein